MSGVSVSHIKTTISKLSFNVLYTIRHEALKELRKIMYPILHSFLGMLTSVEHCLTTLLTDWLTH